MATRRRPTLTEPIPVTDQFATGVDCEHGPDFVRVISWADVPTPGDHERRIISRLVYPLSIARELMDKVAGCIKAAGR